MNSQDRWKRGIQPGTRPVGRFHPISSTAPMQCSTAAMLATILGQSARRSRTFFRSEEDGSFVFH